MILGISGSGRPKGETAKMVKAILEHTGEEYEFITLASKKIAGCTGCLKCAVGDGECRLKDDYQELYHKMKKADAVVLGFPDYNHTINAKTHALIERFYSTRHGAYHLGGKYFVPVSPCGKNSQGMQLVLDILLNTRASILCKVEGNSGVAPCFDCGYGHDCYAGCIIPEGGEAVNPEEGQTMRIQEFDDNIEVQNMCKAAGWKIGRAVKRFAKNKG